MIVDGTKRGKLLRKDRAQSESQFSRVLPYDHELETLGQRYSVHRIVGETETAYGHRVIATIVAAHDRNAAVTALVERDLDRAVQLVTQRYSAQPTAKDRQ